MGMQLLDGVPACRFERVWLGDLSMHPLTTANRHNPNPHKVNVSLGPNKSFKGITSIQLNP